MILSIASSIASITLYTVDVYGMLIICTALELKGVV